MSQMISNIFPRQKNVSNHSIKSNAFKKSSTQQNNLKNNNNTKTSSNSNIFLNLYSKFNNKTSLHKNSKSSAKIVNSINNTQKKQSSNINSPPIKTKSNHYIDNPSLINSMNLIENHGHINIRLNLKSKIINNNNINSDMAEKILEKDKQIVKLQNALMKSQELINQLNKKTQMQNRILSLSYTSTPKGNLLTNSYKEKDFSHFTQSSDNSNEKIKTTFNSNSFYSQNNKKKNNGFIVLCNNHIINFSNNNNITNKRKNNYKKNKILSFNKSNKKQQTNFLKYLLPLSGRCFSETKTRFNSYTSLQKKTLHKNLNDIHIQSSHNDKKHNKSLDKFIDKCEELKQKSKKLLNNYLNLTNAIIKSKKEQKRYEGN